MAFELEGPRRAREVSRAKGRRPGIRSLLRTLVAGTVVLGGPLTAVAGEAPAASAATVAVIAAHPGGINFGAAYEQTFSSMPSAQQVATMAQIASVGISWIRLNVPFAAVEPVPGQFHWYMDSTIQLAVAEGIHIDALISYPPAWARGAGGEPDPGDFAQFAGVAAAHLSSEGVSTFELCNEPNLATNWGASVDPADDAALLRATYPAIKSVDPTSMVVSGGLAPAPDAGDGSSLSPYTYLADLYADGAGGSFDAVAIHPYSYPDLPMQSAPWNSWYNLPEIHDLMVAEGDGAKQVWLTEYGAPTAGPDAVSDGDQATMMSDAFAAADSWSWAGPVFLFDWRDDAGDGDFGLINNDGTPKPAYAAVAEALTATAPTPPTPPTAPTGAIINSGQGLVAGEQITSPDGLYRLVLQADGNLVEYLGTRALFNTRTAGDIGDEAVMQADGNFVLYSSGHVALWNTQTMAPGSSITLQNDSNLVVYQGAEALWSDHQPVGLFTLGQVLHSGQQLLAPDGAYRLVMQADGNLVEYSASGAVLWNTTTFGHAGAWAVMQADGNVVEYSVTGAALWNTRTFQHAGAWMTLQTDGNLVVYQAGVARYADHA